MPGRPSRPKRPRDVNQLAAYIVKLSTEGEDESPPEREKNPAAVALGKLGGAKGGKAKAAKRSPEQRKEIARKAAAKRWGNRQLEHQA